MYLSLFGSSVDCAFGASIKPGMTLSSFLAIAGRKRVAIEFSLEDDFRIVDPAFNIGVEHLSAREPGDRQRPGIVGNEINPIPDLVAALLVELIVGAVDKGFWAELNQ